MWIPMLFFYYGYPQIHEFPICFILCNSSNWANPLSSLFWTNIPKMNYTSVIFEELTKNQRKRPILVVLDEPGYILNFFIALFMASWLIPIYRRVVRWSEWLNISAAWQRPLFVCKSDSRMFSSMYACQCHLNPRTQQQPWEFCMPSTGILAC